MSDWNFEDPGQALGETLLITMDVNTEWIEFNSESSNKPKSETKITFIHTYFSTFTAGI